MANQEHLAVLKQGVGTWNEWREDYPGIVPDLYGALLHGADLREANLRAAILIQAGLSGTNLRGAHLRFADLREADLCEADLSDAYLLRADLRRADLRGARLCGAELSQTNVTEVDLAEANLSKAVLGWTVFGSVDLSCAIGLETAIHEGPSTIGIDTIFASRGKIPEAFLRGCGVPDGFITFMHSLVAANAIQFCSCFISYSSKDQEFVERVHSDLQAKGVRCWFAPEDLKIGDKIWDRLDRSIRVHDKLLLILSERSIASDWVADEVTTAFEEERRRGKTVLFPVRLDDCVMTSPEAWAGKVRQRHIGDFRQWKDHVAYKRAFERLLRDLQAEAE